jgi:hypothetical protein
VIRETATNWPLYWPPGWERTKHPTRALVRPTTVYRESQRVMSEILAMGGAEGRRLSVISTNMKLKQDGSPYSGQKQPDDRGVSVWFDLAGEERVLACDRWDRVEHNLHAIAIHVAALRGMDRWGVGSAAKAFAGFVALPETAGGEPWHETLRVAPNASRETIDAAYRRLAFALHPDRGGDRAKWDALQEVRKVALAAAGGR